MYCRRELSKRGMTRHLATCAMRHEAIATSAQGRGNTELLYHLRAEDAWHGDFWLDLELRAGATLADLDRYLRAIWLECCGHMSRFSTRGWRSPDVPMSRRAKQSFRPGAALIHQYDFGTTSETVVRCVSSRRGKPNSKRPLVLMARNVLPEAHCLECGKPASWLCMECLIEDEVAGTLCDKHAKTHPHDQYGDPVAIVNSPRLGMCGYTGPADPPY